MTEIVKFRRKRCPRRTAWAGLNKAEIARPGSTLLAWLLRQANDRGQQLQEMAADLGVTYGYIAQLRGGLREVRHISPAFIGSCARYLSVPPVAIKVAAGIIGIEDFLVPGGSEEQQFDAALRHIQADPLLGPMMPPQMLQSDMRMKRFVVACYQEATGVDFAIGQRVLPAVMSQLQKACLIEAERVANAGTR